MAAPRKVPDKTTLARWKRQGLSQQEMAERIRETTGVEISRATIAGAMVRYGLADEKPRYSIEIPWRVKMEHISAYPARMLRLLGKRDSGVELNPQEERKLNSWLAQLDRENAVVAYDPDSAQGFFYIERQKNDPKDIPVRKNRVYMTV